MPGIGADDTLALKDVFEAQFGKAKRSYLVGASMGGNVVALSLENFKDAYDGALAICGALGGEEEIDFLTSWTALAEFTSGVKIPIGEGSKDIAAIVIQQLPKALGSPAAPTEKGTQFISAIRMLTGGPRPFYLEGLQEQLLLPTDAGGVGPTPDPPSLHLIGERQHLLECGSPELRLLRQYVVLGEYGSGHGIVGQWHVCYPLWERCTNRAGIERTSPYAVLRDCGWRVWTDLADACPAGSARSAVGATVVPVRIAGSAGHLQSRGHLWATQSVWTENG